MATKKVTDLTALTTTATGDILLIVDDPSGSAATKKITIDNLFVASTAWDLNGKEFILDADQDTSITADTDDQIDIRVSGADDFQITANKFLCQTGSVIDLNGQDLLLDADADSYLHESADDVIDLVLAGASGELAININSAEDFTFTANSFNVLAGSAVVVNTADGIDYTPASDEDSDLITVNVTGTPTIKWDESEDAFSANKGLNVTGALKLGDGGSSNYAQFAADGELTLAGTARVTRCVMFANAALGKGGTVPDEVIVGNFEGWSYDIGDDSVFTTKLPNDWATGTDVIIAIRWCINEAYAAGGNNGEVNWQATWIAIPADSTEAINGAGTTDTSGDVNIPATAYYLTQTTVETIPGASLAANDEIGITIERVAINDGNDPTADPVITCVGLQYTADKLGAAT